MPLALYQVTGKAVMLDEIINYVQSLQRQIEVSAPHPKHIRRPSSLVFITFSAAFLALEFTIILQILFLQFLSMKLAAVNPRPEFNYDNFLNKEVG